MARRVVGIGRGDTTNILDTFRDMTPVDAAEVVGDDPMALYRLYAEDGTLLYVGITHSLSARFTEHALDKPWWPQVTRKTVAWYGSRAEASRAESRAVKDEDPVHNIRLRRRRAPTKQADRHAPDNPTITVRPGPELLAWLASEKQRRGVARSALIIEALREKREREAAGA